MHSGILRARQVVIFLFIFLSLTILIVRLFYLQKIKHNFFVELANDQHVVSIELLPKRGTIFDRNMRVLAMNLHVDSVYANAREVIDKNRVAKTLSSILNLDENFILERLSRDKSFVWLKRRVAPTEAYKVKRLRFKGISLMKESKRFYPNRSLACHVVGVSGIDNKGLEGLELFYDRFLKGESGWLTSTQDARRKILKSYEDELIPPKNGLNLVTTIDEVIQHIAEREL